MMYRRALVAERTRQTGEYSAVQ